jgi:hypothetical protein
VIKAWRKKKLKMLWRIFGPSRKYFSGSGEKYIIICLVNCVPHPVNFGWLNREKCDGRGI